MLLVDKRENLNTSVIMLSMNILSILRRRKAISSLELFKLIENRSFKENIINKNKFIWALLFLYATGKIIYIPESDFFMLR